ncbi:hypothetical protein MAPG_01058 [Magnaporthiopsis poae ATCC 64411]|uniref:Uncharacterized protein n=1 Tax=Magnaporthiopsis poae (strain ATCC 64411 / 73-15) TaxID=644358 RepID=A0A0C4DMP7_MAGP6|nr:hypothetical protein MAPG_01058 [Magnaporthiopsis poae ATCC 64411]
MTTADNFPPQSCLKMVDIAKSRFWNEEKESRLQRECPDFVTQVGESELGAWKMAQFLFKTDIPDIFTYGLRLDPQLEISSQLPEDRSEFFARLQDILPHPVFQRSAAHLRFVLQMAVFFNVEGHVEPYGPVPQAASVTSAVLDPRKGKDAASVKDGASLVLALWKDFGSGQGYGIRLVLDQLQRQAAERKEDDERMRDETEAPPEWPAEAKQLFFVGIQELIDVADALDSVDHFFAGRCLYFRHRLDHHVNSWGGWATVAPLNLYLLEEMVNLAAQRDELKYRLRKALRIADGEADRRDLHVFDIPDNDPEPEYAFADELESDVRSVLAGDICPRRYPLICTSSSLDGGGVQAALGQFCGASRDAAGVTIAFAWPIGSRPASPDFWLLPNASDGGEERSDLDAGLHEVSSLSGDEDDGESETDSLLLRQFASQVDDESVSELLAGGSRQVKGYK